MRHDIVWVEVDSLVSHDQVLRIFRNGKEALASHGLLSRWPRRDAVSSIRHQIFLRSKGDCELCGSPITEITAHMHEQKHRGKGGEISLENSVIICAKCHRSAHADREPKFTRRHS